MPQCPSLLDVDKTTKLGVSWDLKLNWASVCPAVWIVPDITGVTQKMRDIISSSSTDDKAKRVPLSAGWAQRLLLTKSKEWETPERDTHELQSGEHWSLFSVLDPSRKMQLTFILVFLVAVSQMSLKSMSFNPVTSPLWLWPRAGLWERNLGSISFPAEAQCRTPEWSWILVSAAWRGKTGQPKKNTYARNRKLKVRCWEYQRVQGPRRMVRDV